MTKICMVLTPAALAALQNAPVVQAGGQLTAISTGSVTFAVLHTQHPHLRFELAQFPQITVLPGMHDPLPIGQTIATALAVVNALPTETMRVVAMRLYALLGPIFHPDV
jgi:hypothetical protein